MASQQDDSNASPPEEKFFVYHQGHINVTSLYLTTKLADVHFAFDSDDGNVTRVPAHRSLLVVTSDVFEKMFCGELVENGDVKIVDATEAAFKEFLQFFYLNDVKLSTENVGSVLYLGNKYNVKNCVDACVKFLTDELSNENVCAALSLAILHEQNDLMKDCEMHIMLNTADIFKSDEFLECSKDALAHILKMNQLVFSCSEVDVFEACMEWVRAKSQQQVLSKAIVDEHLGELFYQIRFASMTTKEFLALKTKYNAVLSSDFEAIIRLIERVDDHTEQFNTSPRQIQWNDDIGAVIVFERDIDNPEYIWSDLDAEEKIIFSTSKPLVLSDLVCGLIRYGKSDAQSLRSKLSVEVKITETGTLDDANDVKVLCSMIANVGSNRATISMPHPILIRPDLYYIICITGFPQGHCFESCDLKSSVTLEPDVEIKFHNDKVVDGKIVGLIYSLRFNKI